MGVSVVIGGQFGSEGKGKVARYFAEKNGAAAVVRVGGINSGHTVIDASGKPIVFRILPTAAIDRTVNCILPAGSYLDVDMLFQEIQQAGIALSKVKIHPNAAVITQREVQAEFSKNLSSRIGSTESGTGAAVCMRVSRDQAFKRAKDVDALRPYICDTNEFLREELSKGHEILIEGTQGFGLSNLHSPYYPYATSRDTSAAGFLSEAGLSPFDVTNIIMVIRSFPIRVSGNSGPLTNEITWNDVTERARSLFPINEYTSVTKKLRRVGEFDPDIVKQAIDVNRPNKIVLNHMDYIYDIDNGLGSERRKFIEEIQHEIGSKIDYIGLNPETIIPV